MKRQLIIAVAAVFASLAALAGTQAVGYGKQKPLETVLELGTKSGELVITPGELKLQTGKLYKLIVNNPSDATHYLSVPEFGTAVRTSKIDAQGGAVKRTGFQNPRATLARFATNTSHKVQEIEVRPGATAVWYFTPVRTGSYKFGCGIPAHAEAGMVSNIRVN